MLLREPPWGQAPPTGQRLRRLTAIVLHGASLALARLAQRLAAATAPVTSAAPVLEFHAEAGAPEGALYVDGQLVGHLPGVTRL
ncbi:MAG: hypothetical protein Q8N44_20865 [Rubrivivax sp.]|nr:hypothetical protein [Rubrivivax sp.]